jgi:steroid delta-isomerase-like uncharacterized protein
MEGVSMSVEDNKAIARRFIQVWGDGNLDIVDELAAPSLVVRYPTIPEVIRGSREFRHVLAGFRSAFPDSVLRVEEEIAEGEKVVVRWSFSGTHKGSLLGVPATGKKVTWTGITIYRIVDGKVTEEQGEEDFLGFFRQVGLIREPV